MANTDIINNINNLLKLNTNKALVRASISYLSQNLEKASQYDLFFEIDYEKYGKQIVESSNISPAEKENINQLWGCKGPKTARLSPISRAIERESPPSFRQPQRNNPYQIISAKTPPNSKTSVSAPPKQQTPNCKVQIPEDCDLYDLIRQLMNEIYIMKKDFSAKISEMSHQINNQQKEIESLKYQLSTLTRTLNEQRIKKIENDLLQLKQANEPRRNDPYRNELEKIKSEIDQIKRRLNQNDQSLLNINFSMRQKEEMISRIRNDFNEKYSAFCHFSEQFSGFEYSFFSSNKK